MSWTNDPPNPKIKDWNVTEIKVPHLLACPSVSLTRAHSSVLDRPQSGTRRQVDRGALLEDARHVDDAEQAVADDGLSALLAQRLGMLCCCR